MGKFFIVSGRKELFPRIRTRAQKLAPAHQAAMQAWRDVGTEEFEREGFFLRTGGFRPWKPTSEFGNTPAPAKTLTRSGRLLASYLGVGAGGFEQISGNTVRFGSRLPYAAVHRRGAHIQVTERMRRFLAAVKGVYLRKSTTTIRIPARPHFQASKEVRTRIANVYANFLADGSTATTG
jgi:phage gpG-like protein